MRKELKDLLVKRRFLVADEAGTRDASKNAYMNAYLLCNYGIAVDKPGLLTKEMVEDISRLYKLNVPASFYANPQDLRYFTKSELLIEQLVSYFLVETGTGIYTRPEIFKKDLPEYKVGDEIVLRNFTILEPTEALAKLREVADAYCAYTRPFGLDEVAEFELLFNEGLVDTENGLKCKDNIMLLLDKNVEFAKFLDKKDVVKLSIKYMGEKASLDQAVKALSDKQATILEAALKLSRNCPLSKKQAKYFNKLIQKFGDAAFMKQVEANSPYKKATALFKQGKIYEAAQVYAKNGSLLQRNLKMLLSRANPEDQIKILGLLEAKNPIVLLQLVNTLKADGNQARTFTFFAKNKVKRHVETDYEARWRKSRLSEGTLKFLREKCIGKVLEYYANLPKLGKIYINPAFYNIGLPTNTSASGKGIDTLPTGSRVACQGKYIRSFIYWKNAYDIDSDLLLIFEDGRVATMNYCNYSEKPFGNDILFSGDDRGRDGAEYFDINLQAMKARGCKYIIQGLHGYQSTLNEGEIYCGYQNKDDLNTRAWDPKNMALQFHVKGDTRYCTAFAIDLDTMEIISLNLMVECNARTLTASDGAGFDKYLDPSFLDLNIGNIMEQRGELVATPEEADIVLDDTAVINTEKQKVIRTFELEKLVALANAN